jgi:hypothetical protein
MKMKIAVMLSSLILMAVTVNAQGGYQRRTVEERVQMTNQKFDSTFKLDNTKQADVDSAFANFYRSADKVREDMMSGGGQPDFQAMREKMQPLMEERDKKLEGILTADQFKIWKDSLEPSMRPRRQNNGGGNNR